MLRSALDRDLLFDRLWAQVPSAPHLKRLIKSELKDLQKGDIPFFTTRPESRDIWTSGDECIENFLAQSAMDRV